MPLAPAGRAAMLFYRWRQLLGVLSVVVLSAVPPAWSEQPNLPAQPIHTEEPRERVSSPEPVWRYGAFADTSYALNFNSPDTHVFRSRGTTARTNEWAPNMLLGYARKRATQDSPWGVELGGQAGYDSRVFAFGQDRPLLEGADTLRHLAYANVSYRAPGGVMMVAGLFDSLIGYESLYAVKNPNYSRSWMAENSPYKMMGLYARYPVGETVAVGAGIINGYWHLAHPNNQPSYVGQVSWKVSDRLTVTENLHYGPDQRVTSLAFWRLFSNFIAAWEGEALTLAFSYDIGTERMADSVDYPRTFWTGAALFARWNIEGPWSIAVRPEAYWDRDGRQTGSKQFVAVPSPHPMWGVRLAGWPRRPPSSRPLRRRSV